MIRLNILTDHYFKRMERMVAFSHLLYELCIFQKMDENCQKIEGVIDAFSAEGRELLKLAGFSCNGRSTLTYEKIIK